MAKPGKISCPSCGAATGVQILRGPAKKKAGVPAGTRYYCIRCGFEWSGNLR